MYKDELLDITQKLICSVEQSLPSHNNLGIMSGLTGRLLFLYEASKVDELTIDESKFEQYFSFLQNNLHYCLNNYSLCDGIVGIGWFLEYVNQDQDNYDPTLLESIDTKLLNKLKQENWDGEIEMMLGLAGFSVYAGRRAKLTNQAEFYKFFLNLLDGLAVRTEPNSVTWQQPANSVFLFDKEGDFPIEFNLGLAHGVPGIIASILPALRFTETSDQARDLLVKSCYWLTQQKLTTVEGDGSHFSNIANRTEMSRLGWCYGDLTIALTLARVGKALDIQDYKMLAQDVISHASKRDAKSGQLVDVGVCHGSAGLAAIFSEFKNVLGEDDDTNDVEKASKFWTEYTLELYRRHNLKGFYELNGYLQKRKENTGFLCGYAGVGLAFISLITGKNNWLDCLLLK